MVKDSQALRRIAQILAVTIAAELNNISGKDRSCNGRFRGPISDARRKTSSMSALLAMFKGFPKWRIAGVTYEGAAITDAILLDGLRGMRLFLKVLFTCRHRIFCVSGVSLDSVRLAAFTGAKAEIFSSPALRYATLVRQENFRLRA